MSFMRRAASKSSRSIASSNCATASTCVPFHPPLSSRPRLDMPSIGRARPWVPRTRERELHGTRQMEALSPGMSVGRELVVCRSLRGLQAAGVIENERWSTASLRFPRAPKELGERRRWRRGWLRPHCHARPPARAPSRGHQSSAARPSACVAPSAAPATCVDSPAAKEDRCIGNARRAAALPRPPLARAPSRVAARIPAHLPVSRAVQHPSHLLWIACQRRPAPRLTPTRLPRAQRDYGGRSAAGEPECGRGQEGRRRHDEHQRGPRPAGRVELQPRPQGHAQDGAL
eukprot:scaffold113207_cov54-Phaeocystis_antarctica.AAC.3